MNLIRLLNEIKSRYYRTRHYHNLNIHGIVPDKLLCQKSVTTRDGRRVWIHYFSGACIVGKIEGQEQSESWLLNGSAHCGSKHLKDLINI